MKNIYKLLLCIVLGLLSFTHVFSQATLTINPAGGAASSSVIVPVEGSGISDMVGFQFTIEYDKAKLEYVSCTNWGGGTNGLAVQVTSLDGKITFIYNDVAVNISSGKFFDLNFNVKASTSGVADIIWSDNPTLRELSNSIPEEISCVYEDGSVDIESQDLTAPTVIAPWAFAWPTIVELLDPFCEELVILNLLKPRKTIYLKFRHTTGTPD